MNRTTKSFFKHPWLRFLSSMDLAVSLLVMLAISSVIGTIIQQNQAYVTYSIKFGPFWFEVFELLGLYDLYGEIWFLSVLAFLAVSVLVCVWRNAPIVWRELKSYPSTQSWQNLMHFKHVQQFAMPLSITDIQHKLKLDNKYKISPVITYHDQEGEYYQIAGKRGTGQKLGYFFTHIGVIVICLGALLDSSFMLKIAEWRGDITYETRDIELNKTHPKAWIETDNHTFRGSVSIPEGKLTNVLFLPWHEGYLIQKLPFYIRLMDFRIQHYPTGPPKSFESDLQIVNLDGEFITSKTINVNNPLTVEDITIYQSSFEDGGSALDLTIQNFHTLNLSTLTLNVKTNKLISIDNQPVTLELNDFRLFNIQPLEHSPNKFRNQGPNFTYKLRDQTGQAFEYQNYMTPITKQNKSYLVSGIRKKPSEEFRYLHIPLDDQLSSVRFFNFLQWLQDKQKIPQIIKNSATLQNNFPPPFDPSVITLIAHTFVKNGYQTILDYLAKNPQSQQEKLAPLFFNITKVTLFEIYRSMIRETEQSTQLSQAQIDFFHDAILTISVLKDYAYPVFLRLKNFKHVQASGLQVTKTQGQFWVYLGCLLLVIGIFCMFYLPISRLWIGVRKEDVDVHGQSSRRLIIAIDSIKNDSDHQKEIHRVRDLLGS